MKRSRKEKASLREQFRNMSAAEKLQYITDYYKWPILLFLLALAIGISAAVRMAGKKEPVLYFAQINTSFGSELEETLTTGFLEEAGYDLRKQEIYEYRDLYLSRDPAEENHAYAYASEMKVMASINAEQLDLVLMNREAYDLLSAQGYLLELPELCAEDDRELYQTLIPYMVENTVVLSDNSLEVTLGEAEQLQQDTEQVQNGLDCSGLPVFGAAGVDGSIYLGVVANSPRLPAVRTYLRYLLQDSVPG